MNIKKLLVSAKKSTADAIKTASRREIQKKAKAAGVLIGNKVADKITSASKSSTKLHLQNNLDETNIPKEKHISPEKRQQIIK